MNGEDINNLLNLGATDRVRKKLKRMGMTDRLKTLQKCIPFVKTSPASLKFFKENFAQELGALIMADGDLEKAESLYRTAKDY